MVDHLVYKYIKMGVQDLMLSEPVIQEEVEDEWICQELMEKVKLHVEENKSDVFINAKLPVAFKRDVPRSENKNLKNKPRSPASSPRKVRKLCRKCPYANCCQSVARVYRARPLGYRKHAPMTTASPETREQMEKFVDILLAELDDSVLSDCDVLSDDSCSTSSSGVFSRCRTPSLTSHVSTSRTSSVSSSGSEDEQDAQGHVQQERVEEDIKLVRSMSCDGYRAKRESTFRRLSVNSNSSRCNSPELKKNVVSWAYEGHSAF